MILGYVKNYIYPNGRFMIFDRNCRGAVAIIVALLAPVLVGFGALIVDVGVWYGTQIHLQNAADAGAMAGARTLPYSESKNADFEQSVVTNSESEAEPGLSKNMTTTYNITTTGSVQNITVITESPEQILLSGIFGHMPLSITAAATASVYTNNSACVMALGQGSGDGIIINDSASTLYSPTCSAFSASNIQNKGSVTTPVVSAVGSISGPFASQTIVMQAVNPIANPYASVIIPQNPQACASVGACPNNIPVNSNVVIDPGTYYGGISVGSNSTVFFQPGIYYIEGGNLSFGGNSSISGSGVTFVFEPDSNGNVGSIDWNGNGSSVSLSGPSNGLYDNILFYQASPANLATHGCTCAYITGNSNYNLSGGIDLQGGTAIEFSGNSTVGQTVVTVYGLGINIVAKSIIISGHATVNTGDPANSGAYVGGSPYLSQ